MALSAIEGEVLIKKALLPKLGPRDVDEKSPFIFFVCVMPHSTKNQKVFFLRERLFRTCEHSNAF